MKFKTAYIEIDIDLDNGIYIFRDQGGIGKTFLYKTLKKLAEVDESVNCLTYKEGNLRSMTGGLIMCDRFDLYATEELVQQLNVLAETNIILLAYKRISLPVEAYPKFCILERTENKIHVYC